MRLFVAAVSTCLATTGPGCATTGPCDACHVRSDLTVRSECDAGCSAPPGGAVVPPSVYLEDGLSEDEAVATALCNNAAFLEALAQLGLSRGDLIQAHLVANPQLLSYFEVGPKQLEDSLFLPVDAFLLRPRRIELAEHEYDRVGQTLVQAGLDLIRDVRVAYADLVFAVDRAKLGDEAYGIRSKIAEFSELRLKNGEIGELEAITARTDALQAQAAAQFLAQEVLVARERLKLLMGQVLLKGELVLAPGSPRVPDAAPVEQLVDLGLRSRPDLRAAQFAIDAAWDRRKLANWTWLRWDMVLDHNQQGRKGNEFGPGIRLELPIFDRSQGAIARAQADLERVQRAFATVRNRIVQEVATAHVREQQARENLALVEQRILPTLQRTIGLAEKAYAAGGTTYFLVLQSTSQYLDAKGRELELIAALRRARAELERSVGCKLAPLGAPGLPPVSAPAPADVPPAAAGPAAAAEARDPVVGAAAPLPPIDVGAATVENPPTIHVTGEAVRTSSAARPEASSTAGQAARDVVPVRLPSPLDSGNAHDGEDHRSAAPGVVPHGDDFDPAHFQLPVRVREE